VKRLIICAILMLTVHNVIAAQYTVCTAGCDFSNITLALENVTGSSDTLVINGTGTYTVTNQTTFQVNGSGNGAILINATGVTFDCQNGGYERIGNWKRNICNGFLCKYYKLHCCQLWYRSSA